MQRPDSMKSANVGDDFARANLKPRPLQSATPGDVIDVPAKSLPSDDMDVMPTSRMPRPGNEQAAARNRDPKEYMDEINEGIREAKQRRAAKGRDKYSDVRDMRWRRIDEPGAQSTSAPAQRQQGWINPKSVGGAAAAATVTGAGVYGLNRMMKKNKKEEEDGYEQG
jgi:hypothetical protein